MDPYNIKSLFKMDPYFLDNDLDYQLPEYKLSAEIAQGRPVMIGIEYNASSGHAIVLCGYFMVGNTPYYIVHDPKHKNPSCVRYGDIYSGFGGAWAYTWHEFGE